MLLPLLSHELELLGSGLVLSTLLLLLLLLLNINGTLVIEISRSVVIFGNTSSRRWQVIKVTFVVELKVQHVRVEIRDVLDEIL